MFDSCGRMDFGDGGKTLAWVATALTLVGLCLGGAATSCYGQAKEGEGPAMAAAKEGDAKAKPKAAAVEKTPAEEVVGKSTAAGLRTFLSVAVVVVVPVLIGMWLARVLRMPDHGWKFALGIGSLLASALLVTTGEIKLGPDLSGGITMIYELAKPPEGNAAPAANAKAADAKQGAASKDGPGDADAADDPDADQGPVGYSGMSKADTMSALIKALNERVDPSGTKEVTIRKYGEDQIEIIIPNAEKQDLDYIERKIYTAGALEFRITANKDFESHRNLIDLATNLPLGENVVRMGDGAAAARWVPYEVTEFGTVEEAAARRGLITRMAGDTPQALVLVNDALDVTGKYLRSAKPGVGSNGAPEVEFTFNERGASLFGVLTGTHAPNPSGQHYQLGILLDNRLLSAPQINEKITDRGQISGGTMDQKEVDFLVGILNAGSLPASLNKDPISRAQISPTLGKETVRKGKFALIVSLVAVALFMLLYYRWAGLIAVFGLAANMLLILGVMVLIKGAFTLPGLAGLVLTVGMSVDANVIINERIRDELKKGSALRMAIRNGYSRAWVTIFDSNVTNLIVAIVIYKIAPDNVKGFGVTLIIGIAMSIFAAVFLTRILFDVWEKKGWLKELKMRQFIGETHFDFIGQQWKFIITSLVIIGVGLAAAAMRKSDLFDIDFTGGSSVNFVLDDDAKMDFAAVEKALVDSELGGQNLSLVELGNTNSRYTVTTVNPDVNAVQNVLKKVFGEKLKSYRAEVKEITPVALQPRSGALLTAAWETAAALPLGPVTLLQDAGAAAPAASTDAAKADAQDEKQDAAAAASATEKAAGTPPAETTKEDAVKPAVVDPFAHGTQATIVFSVDGKASDFDGINHTGASQLVQNALEATGNDNVAFSVSNPGYQTDSIRNFTDWTVKLALPQEKAQIVLDKLQADTNAQAVFPLSNKIGGKIAGRMASDAIWATILSLAGITAYVWFRFHKAEYGIAACVALIHDVLVAIGFVALSSYIVGGSQALADMLMVDKFQIGLTLVAAFLTIIGYSLNDTIVVFDRIREVKGKSPTLTKQMINDSVNQTLARTLLTSFTTFMTIVVLYLFAGEGIHGFAYAMLIGVIAGSYSTIFIANPILLWMADWMASKSEASKT